jgi:hypothetical protein
LKPLSQPCETSFNALKHLSQPCEISFNALNLLSQPCETFPDASEHPSALADCL